VLELLRPADWRMPDTFANEYALGRPRSKLPWAAGDFPAIWKPPARR
jgi:hypothetical protein